MGSLNSKEEKDETDVYARMDGFDSEFTQLSDKEKKLQDEIENLRRQLKLENKKMQSMFKYLESGDSFFSDSKHMEKLFGSANPVPGSVVLDILKEISAKRKQEFKRLFIAHARSFKSNNDDDDENVDDIEDDAHSVFSATTTKRSHR